MQSYCIFMKYAKKSMFFVKIFGQFKKKQYLCTRF